MSEKITIGTRGSALARVQAVWVKDRLEAQHPELTVDLEIIRTQGDKILDVPLAQVGGKGLFVKEIEEALGDNRVDLAVHSMKDVPTELPDGLFIAVVPEREDFRDALITREVPGFDDLPRGARVGTSSLRRRAQLLRLRPDLDVRSLRGNVDTRLRKLDEEGLDAIVLAAAGLARLGLTHRASQMMEPGRMLPAIGQGALGLEARRGDKRVLDRLEFLHHEATAWCVGAERAFLEHLEGGCQVPLAALARIEGGRLSLDGLIADPEGHRFFRDTTEALPEEGPEAGRRLAQDLLDRGGREVLDEIYRAEESR